MSKDAFQSNATLWSIRLGDILTDMEVITDEHGEACPITQEEQEALSKLFFDTLKAIHKRRAKSIVLAS